MEYIEKKIQCIQKKIQNILYIHKKSNTFNKNNFNLFLYPPGAFIDLTSIIFQIWMCQPSTKVSNV